MKTEVHAPRLLSLNICLRIEAYGLHRVCAANAFECALPRDCCFGVKTDFIDRLKGLPVAVPFCIRSSKAKALHYFFSQRRAIALHRMAAHWQRCRSRKVNSGRQCVPQSPRRLNRAPLRPTLRCTSPMCQRKRKIRCQEGQGNHSVSLPFVPPVDTGSPPPDGGAYSFSSAEEASAAGAAFFVLFPGLPITLYVMPEPRETESPAPPTARRAAAPPRACGNADRPDSAGGRCACSLRRPS